MKKNTLASMISVPFILSQVNNVQALEFGLFGDVQYVSRDAPGENPGFVLGAVDFFATANINEDTRVFIEYVFEDNGDGLVTDLERLWITKTFSDEFSFGVGRFHTPLGNWNRTYHHGAILQDTVSRPFFLDFEDSSSAILPSHIMGGLASGNLIFDNGELNYEVYAANGSSLDTSLTTPELEVNVAGDPNASKAYGFRVTYALDAIPVQLGVMFMDNVIAESAEGTSGTQGIAYGEPLVDQVVTGFDIKANYRQFDFLMEYYRLDNDAKIGDQNRYKSDAYFTQLGYQLITDHKIIYRYSHLDIAENDDYYQLLQVESANRQVLAYRYDVDGSNALKFEYNQHTPYAGDAVNTLTLQWAFLVP